MMKYLLALVILGTWLESFGNEVPDIYIDRFKDIAIAEMERTGIPASIKLAQGLLESDWGRSDLAVTANNHFGIKCGGSWDGEGYYLEDDDTDHRGKIIASCFRVFNSAEESYIAHSEFLTAQDKSGRYAFLFDYDRTDYKAWAKGLKKAGYATDKKYPAKLISIIEKYQLYLLDEENGSGMVTSEGGYPNHSERGHNGAGSRLISTVTSRNAYSIGQYTFLAINGVRATSAIGGETLEQLAAGTGADIDKLMEYNEGYGYRTIVLDKGDLVFFDKKKRTYKGDEAFHLFVEGESMFMVSQMYGIKLDNLYAKNKMPKGAEPLPGVRLYLKATVPSDKRPSYTKHPARNEEIEFLFTETDQEN